ncbi:MAG TPA: hypothetical protein VGO52_19925 [Hyphomonadaceae bacterium]|jgi:hypothetical protein|nr:hypothetical protein [Hyphomonadaceae bacterium]
MKHAIALVAGTLLAGSLLAACAGGPKAAHHFSLIPTESNGQALTGFDSTTTMESRQPGGIVSVRAENQFSQFGASFIIAVQNKSGSPMEFGPQNISATVNDKPIAVLAADELDQRVKSEARGYLRATSRTSDVGAENATPAATREYQYNNYGGNAAGTGGFSGCAMAVDGCRNYRVDRDNREADAKLIADAAVRLQLSSQLISHKALHRESVAPEGVAGGVIVVEPPKSGGPVKLVITVNGKEHKFTFAATPAA